MKKNFAFSLLCETKDYKAHPFINHVRYFMKLSFFVLLLVLTSFQLLLANDGHGQSINSVKVHLELKNETLFSALKKIESKVNFRFAFKEQDIRNQNDVNMVSSTKSLDEILQTILDNRGLNYKQIGTSIIIYRPEIVVPVALPENNKPDEKTAPVKIPLSGKVTDSKGDPLIGVTIMEKGTTNGTVSDKDGKFSISVENENAVLLFRYIGYTDLEVKPGTDRTLSVTLKESERSLNEVVVVGYGTQKKANTTAAISTLKGQDIAQKPVASLSNSLTGRVAGVIITQGNGEPGQDGASIHIRGIGTTGNNSPLIVVDGVYRSFESLDPNSVESFTVLKDAAAVAPYGLAGANGVILITTKKGKSGKPTLTYNSYVGLQNPTRITSMVNSYQYALMQNEAALNENSATTPYSQADLAGYLKTVNKEAGADIDKYPSSNGLKDLIANNRILTSHNLQLSGGTDKVHYYAGLGYLYQQGQWSSTNLNRYNLIAKIDAQATNTTNVSVSINSYVKDLKYPGTSAGGIMYQAFRTPPTYAIKYSNGLYGGYQNRSLLGEVYDTGYDKEESTQSYTNLTIEQKLPLKGLSLKGAVSYDPYSDYEKNWQTPATYYSVNTSTTPYVFSKAQDGQSNPLLIIQNNFSSSLTYQGYLNYHNKFGKSDIAIQGVAEYRTVNSRSQRDERDNYNLDIDELDAGSAISTDAKNSGSSGQQKQVGYVYHATYNYDGKYVAEAIGRYDGHYYFAPGHRYGFFPTFGLSWNLSEENFIKNRYNWIDFWKLRASYGQSGNLAGGPFQYLSAYQLGQGAVFTSSGTPKATQGVYESGQPNPNITWERQKQLDIGMEGSLWQGKLTFDIDYFHQKRNNMLVTRQITAPSEYGISLSQENYGIMSNQGVDLTLGTAQTLANGMRIGVKAILSYAKNKLLRVDELASSYNNLNTRQTGRPLGTPFGYVALGYFTPNDFNADGSLKAGIPTQPWGAVHPGDIRYADLNNDGKITTNNSDQKVIGNPSTPAIQFSLAPNFSWKGFDLDLLFQGATKSSIQIGGTIAYPFDIASSATALQFNDHWTPANTNALYPRLTSAPVPNNQQYSSWFMRNDTYVRLKSAEIGYTIPVKILQKIKIQSVRLYVAGQNLWTWTPYMKEVMDPEAQSTNGQYYFQQQVISFGTNITF